MSINIKKSIFFKHKKETPRQERGRSIVEMLGVLVIIGILTITGIVGYKFAMNTHAANKILNDVKMRANDIHLKRMHLKQVSIDDWPRVNEMGNLITAENFETMFTVTVAHISPQVCQAILRIEFPAAYQIRIGQIPVSVQNSFFCTQQEFNDMTFYFNDELSSQIDENSCGGAYQHYNDRLNTCEGCTNNDQCDHGEICNTSTGECVVPYECPKGFFVWGTNGIDSNYSCRECLLDKDCKNPDKPYCKNEMWWGGCTSGCGNNSCPSEKPYCDIKTDTCMECQTNDDCEVKNTKEQKYFCEKDNTGNFSLEGNAGSCQPADYIIFTLTGKDVYGQTYTVEFAQSKKVMRGWQGVNLCRSIGKRMITLQDMGCNEEGCSLDKNAMINVYASSPYKKFEIWTTNINMEYVYRRYRIGADQKPNIGHDFAHTKYILCL